MSKLKVMAIYAHPADPVTDCGGAIAMHAENGDETYALVLTHGGRKHPNYFVKEWRKEHPNEKIINMNKQDVIDFKKAECLKACKILGYTGVTLLGHDDDCLLMTNDIIEEVAAEIAKVCPDIIIMDYPYPHTLDAHSLTSQIAFKALERVGLCLQNMDDGIAGNTDSFQYHPKAIFFTKVPVTVSDALITDGRRNDVFIDFTPVVEKKIRAMDQFISQSYHNDFARKFVEAHDGAFGRAGNVSFAEGFSRYYNETFKLLPVSEYAMGYDDIMTHEEYSKIDIRKLYPYDENYYDKNFK